MDTSNRKPDLMSSVHGANHGGTRILATLEYGSSVATRLSRTARWDLNGWTAGVSLTVVVLAAMAWMLRESALGTATERQLPRATVSAVTAAPLASAVESAAGQRAQASVDRTARALAAAPQQPQAAAIINVAQAADQAREHTPPLSRPGAGMAAISGSRTGSPAAKASTSAEAGMSPRVSAAPATVAADTDVALLTALVAHAGKPTSVSPERSRDVVLRQEGDATAPLLERCKQLGLIEGMLCRSRICSGRWESDAACRAPSHAPSQ